MKTRLNHATFDDFMQLNTDREVIRSKRLGNPANNGAYEQIQKLTRKFKSIKI